MFPLECLVARIANINATNMSIFYMVRVFTQICELRGAVLTWEEHFRFFEFCIVSREGARGERDWGSHSETVFLTRFFV